MSLAVTSCAWVRWGPGDLDERCRDDWSRVLRATAAWADLPWGALRSADGATVALGRLVSQRDGAPDPVDGPVDRGELAVRTDERRPLGPSAEARIRPVADELHAYSPSLALMVGARTRVAGGRGRGALVVSSDARTFGWLPTAVAALLADDGTDLWTADGVAEVRV